MNFTLKEYFYRLSNRCIVLMLLPLGTHLIIYYFLLTQMLTVFIQDDFLVKLVLGSFAFISISVLTIVHWSISRRVKKIALEVGLGKKLDLYFPLAKKKIDSMVSVSLIPSAGLLLTGHSWFSIFFAVIFLWYLIQWPSPRKVASDLQLKGDERKMVITKGEAFKI